MEAIDQRHLRISVEFGIAQLGLMPQVYGRNMQILAFVYVLVNFRLCASDRPSEETQMGAKYTPLLWFCGGLVYPLH